MTALQMRGPQILFTFLLTSLNAVCGQQFQIEQQARSFPVPLPIVLNNNPLPPLQQLSLTTKPPFNIYSIINNVKHFFQNPRSQQSDNNIWQQPTTMSPQLSNLLSNPSNQLLLESILSNNAGPSNKKQVNNIRSKMITKKENEDDNTVVLAAPYSVSSDVIRTLVHIADTVKNQDKKVQMMEKVLQLAKPQKHLPEHQQHSQHAQHHVINSNYLPHVEAASNSVPDLLERDKLAQLFQQQQILMSAQQSPHSQLVVAPSPQEQHHQNYRPSASKSDSVKKFTLKSRHKNTPTALSSVLNHYGIDADHLKTLLNSKANELKKLQSLFQPATPNYRYYDNSNEEETHAEISPRGKTQPEPKDNVSSSSELSLIRSMLVKLTQDELNTIGKLIRVVIQKPQFLPRILNEGISDKVKRVLQVIQVLKFPETLTEKNKIDYTTMPPLTEKQWNLKPRLSPDKINVKKDSLVPLLYWLSDAKESPPKSNSAIGNPFLPRHSDYFLRGQFSNRRSFFNQSTNSNPDLLINTDYNTNYPSRGFSESINQLMSGTDQAVYQALPSSTWINSTFNNPNNQEIYHYNPITSDSGLQHYPHSNPISTTISSVYQPIDNKQYWQNTAVSGDWVPLVPNQATTSRSKVLKEDLQNIKPKKQYTYGSKITKKKQNSKNNIIASREGYYASQEELPKAEKLHQPRRKQKLIVYSDEIQSEETKVDEIISPVHVGRVMDFDKEKEYKYRSDKKKYGFGNPFRSRNSYVVQFDSSGESSELERGLVKRKKLPSALRYKIVDWASNENYKFDFQQPITIIPCSTTVNTTQVQTTTPVVNTTITRTDISTSSTISTAVSINSSDYSTVLVQQVHDESGITDSPDVMTTTPKEKTKDTTTEAINSTTMEDFTTDSTTVGTSSTNTANVIVASARIGLVVPEFSTTAEEYTTTTATTTEKPTTTSPTTTTTTTTTTEAPTTSTATTTVESSTNDPNLLPDFQYLFTRKTPQTTATSPFPVYVHTNEPSTTQIPSTDKSPLRMLYDYYMKTTNSPTTSTETENSKSQKTSIEEFVTPDVIVSVESDVNSPITTSTSTKSFLDLYKPSRFKTNVFTRTHNPHETLPKPLKSTAISLRGAQPRQIKAKDKSELSGYFPMGYWPKLFNNQNSESGDEHTTSARPNIKLRWFGDKSRKNL